MSTLLWVLAAYAGTLFGALFVTIAIKRRRGRRAWERWHLQQGWHVFLWTRLRSRSRTKRLTYQPTVIDHGALERSGT